MRAAAQQIGVWDAERTALLSGLARANELDLLVRVFLDEGEIGQALEALAALKKHERCHSCHTDLAVVQAAEATRPEAAIEIYLDVARLLIRQRDRGSDAEAARYVTRVRD